MPLSRLDALSRIDALPGFRAFCRTQDFESVVDAGLLYPMIQHFALFVVETARRSRTDGDATARLAGLLDEAELLFATGDEGVGDALYIDFLGTLLESRNRDLSLIDLTRPATYAAFSALNRRHPSSN